MKEEKTEVVALESAAVSNNINLNLNQNDLIELAIQEGLEITEKEIDVVNERIRMYLQQIIEYSKSVIDKKKKVILSKYKSFDNFCKIVKDNKLEINNVENCDLYGDDIALISNGVICHTSEYTLVVNSKEKDDFAIPSITDYSGYNNDKDPIRNIKKCKSRTGNSQNIQYPSKINTLSCSARKDELAISFNLIVDTEFTKSEQNAFIEKVKPLYFHIAKLKRELWDLNLKRFEYTHGEKRIKSQIIKASLKKSKQGQEILTMLGNATNIKMLG